MAERLNIALRAVSEVGILLKSGLTQRTSELNKTNMRLSREIMDRTSIEKQRNSMQLELLRAAHQSGMSELATSVLHNVGNALTPLKSAAGLMLEQLSEQEDISARKGIRGTALQAEAGDSAYYQRFGAIHAGDTLGHA